MYDQGHEVVGLDGVEKPILEFFQEQGLAYIKGNDGLPYFCVCILVHSLHVLFNTIILFLDRGWKTENLSL